MSREQCNHYAREILAHFTFQNQIRFSLGEFTGNWDNLKKSVDNWWREYKAWEAQDTLAEAYQQKRLTVKGTSKWIKRYSSKQRIQILIRAIKTLVSAPR